VSVVPFSFVVLRSNGWLIQKSVSLTVPVLVVSLAAVLLGCRSCNPDVPDPLRIGHAGRRRDGGGRTLATSVTYVGVYERSQIGGRAANRFNRMVAGLANATGCAICSDATSEPTWPHRAIEEVGLAVGDVVEAAVLFIDLVGLDEARGKPSSTRGCRGAQRFLPDTSSAPSTNTRTDQQIRGRRRAGHLRAPLRTNEPASGALGDGTPHLRTSCASYHGHFGIGFRRRVFCGKSVPKTVTNTRYRRRRQRGRRLADIAKTSDRAILCRRSAIDARLRPSATWPEAIPRCARTVGGTQISALQRR